MRLYAFPDPRGCGQAVLAAASLRGHTAASDGVKADAAFVRTVNYGDERGSCLDTLRWFGNADIPCVPAPAASDWYDNKLAQFDLLRDWLPPTIVAHTADAAIIPWAYPFVSKSAFGSGSANVRLIRSVSDARAEIKGAFGPGIPAKGGVQRGYLYWQALIPANTRDVRVVVAGRRLYGLIRQCRDDLPFASGSGRTMPVTDLSDPQVLAAFMLADEIAERIDAPWSCYDFVFDSDRAYCLEVSTSWTEASYDTCPVFDRASLVPTGETGEAWAEFAVDALEAMLS